MNTSRGFSLVEIMVGLTIGLIMTIGVLGVYLAQVNMVRSNTSQSSIQNATSAITGLITPVIRSAGFTGCTNISKALSNLNPGGAPPLGTIGTLNTLIMGYDSTAGTQITISGDNTANEGNVNYWLPLLDTSLTGEVQGVSDVLIVLGGTPGATPTGVTSITSDEMVVQNASGITAGQFAAISDCSKTSVFKVTGISGTTLTHAAGSGALANATSAFAVNYPVGSQVIPLTQTAFFTAHDPSGHSALARGRMNSDGTWTIEALIPGVETMQILYGIGSSGILSQYVPANEVTNWDQVYAVQLGFLIAGEAGSATLPSTLYHLIGSAITVPSDNRLRHQFEMTIYLRNSTS